MLKQLLFILLLLPLFVQAKDYEARLQVKNLPSDAQPVLLRIYNGNMYIVDSIPVRKDQENLIFRIPENTTPGVLKCILGMPPYALYTQGQPISLTFIFNREDVEFSLDYNDPAQSAEVLRSVENQIYFDFLKTDALFFRKLGLLEQVVMNYPDKDEFYLKALEYYKKFQFQRDKLIDKTYNNHRHTLAGKIIKNQKLPITEGVLTPQQRDSIFHHGFLSKIDFSDTLLLYTSVYTDKAFQYIQMSMKRDVSPRENEANCIRALDELVPHLDVNPIVQQHILQFLITGFESMKMEEVLAHISANYIQQCGGSGEIIKRRLEGYQRMSIGQQVPDFTTTDIKGEIVNLYNTISPYTLIIFWHTECGHCQMLMQNLPQFAQQEFFRQHQIKIIGISIDEDKEKWEEFSARYGLEWTNIHIEGSFDNSIANDYNLFATPSMFLLDENHKIIAKPTNMQELKKNVKEIK